MKPTAKAATPYAQIPKTYASLMAMHMLRPIHDQIDAENAAETIDLLAGHKLNPEQTDYLDLVSGLYEKWETAQSPMNGARGDELMQLALTARGEKAGDLAKLLGLDVSLAYRLLCGERQLTTAQISKVADHFGLDPAALLP